MLYVKLASLNSVRLKGVYYGSLCHPFWSYRASPFRWYSHIVTWHL